MSVEAEAVQKGASYFSSLARAAQTAWQILKDTHDFNRAAVELVRTLRTKKAGKIRFGGRNGLAQNYSISYLYVRDGKDAAESKEILNKLGKRFKESGVLWAETKRDFEANGIPSCIAIRQEDAAGVGQIMKEPAFENLLSFNPKPTAKDFDPELTKGADMDKILSAGKKPEPVRKEQPTFQRGAGYSQERMASEGIRKLGESMKEKAAELNRGKVRAPSRDNVRS